MHTASFDLGSADNLGPGGVCTLIALHYGCKMKNESFTSCRSRVNISSGSKIVQINVECNGDSLTVAIPSKVKKCWQACVTPVIPPLRSSEHL